MVRARSKGGPGLQKPQASQGSDSGHTGGQEARSGVECSRGVPSLGPWLWLLMVAGLLNGHWTRKDNRGHRLGGDEGTSVPPPLGSPQRLTLCPR